MYGNILLPIDGSEVALGAARHGIALAKALGAKATAIMVTTPWAIQFAREVASSCRARLSPRASTR
jgi:nucleotide-binding universal stress UspA family protein